LPINTTKVQITTYLDITVAEQCLPDGQGERIYKTTTTESSVLKRTRIEHIGLQMKDHDIMALKIHIPITEHVQTCASAKEPNLPRPTSCKLAV
jgi:hypothetical protein